MSDCNQSLFTFVAQTIENCEGRFSDEELAEIVETVKKTLPPPPVEIKPGETNGTEETATLDHEKGNEISQDQNAGVEQMETRLRS